MGKLGREALATYIDTGFNAVVDKAGEASWELLGTDIEEMSVELNSDTETRKNILGQTKTQDNGYEASMDADPFYADPESVLYTKLRDIALNRLKGSACKTLMLEVIIEDPKAANHSAWVREVMIKPQSYGGGTEGLNIPFSVSEDGAFIAGTVTAESLKAKTPVFTPDGESLSN